MLHAESTAGFRETFRTLSDYEASWMWDSTKLRYRLYRPMCCFVCGRTDVELHHRSYRHVGKERLDELVPLCGEDHAMVEKLVRGGWASRWDAHILLKQRLELRENGQLRRLREAREIGRAAA